MTLIVSFSFFFFYFFPRFIFPLLFLFSLLLSFLFFFLFFSCFCSHSYFPLSVVANRDHWSFSLSSMVDMFLIFSLYFSSSFLSLFCLFHPFSSSSCLGMTVQWRSITLSSMVYLFQASLPPWFSNPTK